MRATIHATKTAPTASEAFAAVKPHLSVKKVNTVLTPSSGVFAFPIMRILTEYKAIIVRMLASSTCIFIFVCKRPVARPASIPAAKAAKSERSGCTPCAMSTPETAPPVAKLASTVRSAMSRIRNVMYTPSVITLHKIPTARAPCTANNNPIFA